VSVGWAIHTKVRFGTTTVTREGLVEALHEQDLPDRWRVEVFNTAALTQLIHSKDSTHADALASFHALGTV
jgi:hypothetical protein